MKRSTNADTIELIKKPTLPSLVIILFLVTFSLGAFLRWLCLLPVPQTLSLHAFPMKSKLCGDQEPHSTRSTPEHTNWCGYILPTGDASAIRPKMAVVIQHGWPRRIASRTNGVVLSVSPIGIGTIERVNIVADANSDGLKEGDATIRIVSRPLGRSVVLPYLAIFNGTRSKTTIK